MKAAGKPVIDAVYTLEKYPGKGGWVYVVVDPIPQVKKEKFGWVRVKGTIDGYEIKQYRLMPMKAGTMFLPVKAAIRKKIGKKEGDKVKVILYPDDSSLEIPEELVLCLKEEPAAWKTFQGLSESEKRLYILWIYSAKTEPTRTNRIVKSMERLAQGLKLYEKTDTY